MSKERIFNSIYFNIFILFINTSVSDELFKTFFIHPSIISITRLLLNIIFILMTSYYFLTKRIKLKKYILSILFLIFLGGTILWTPNKFEAIKLYINFLGPCSYFVLLFSITNKEKAITILKKYCSLIIFTDIISILIFKNIGYMNESATVKVVRGIHLSRSTMIIYLNFCIFIFLYYLTIIKNYSHKEKNKTIVMIVLSVLLIAISRSSTGIVIMTLFIPLLFVAKSKVLSKVILKLSIIIGIGLPVINITSPIINTIIKDLFGKTLTFSGRRYIWEYALDKLTNNPILGNGFNSTESLLKGKVIPIYERVAAHTHNGFLELFLQTGTVGFILLIIILLVAYKYTFRLDKGEDNLIRAYFIIFAIFNFMEPYTINTVSIITLWLPIIYLVTLVNKILRENTNE